MLIVPFACAEFHDKSGNVIHRIHAHELRNITEVPDAIVQDPLYALMVEEGSLKAPESRLDLRALENDPEAKPQDPIPEKKPEAPEPEQKQKPRNEAGNKPSSRQGPADKP